MRKALIGYAGVFVLAFLLFLLAGLPTAVVLEHVVLPEGLRVSNPRGSVWSGQATLADRHGPLGDIDWRLDILPLLVGRLGAELHFHGPLGEARGHLLLDNPVLELRDLELSLDVLAITSRPPAWFPTRGRLLGTIEQARLDTNGLQQLDGQLSLQQAGLTFPKELALGDFVIDLVTEQGSIIGDITSSDRPLRAGGQVRITQGSRYQLDLTLRPHSTADPALEDALALAGRPTADGSVSLTRRGDLRQWLTN